MISRTNLLILILFTLFHVAYSQKLKKADKLTLANLETHIHYLSDDKLQGRGTGTPGEKLASDYISIAFTQAGLQPKGDNNGWLQAFPIDEGRQISTDTHFNVNNQEFVLGKDYFPLAFSAVGTVSGSPAIALQERGVPWFLNLREMLETNQKGPHFDLEAAIRVKIAEYSKKGATAVILYNDSKYPDYLAFVPGDRSKPVSIPVIYITRQAKKKYLKDESASLDIKISVGFTEKTLTGHNVVGYLDNGSLRTVIIGAHYDHWGYEADTTGSGKGAGATGGAGNAGDAVRTVFHGADDNASGVAAIIELARLLKGSGLKNNNYLFIAFSSEELGQYGSSYFVAHSTADMEKANYMINLDMVGHLNDSSHLLTVGGYGTSPAWTEIFNHVSNKKSFTLQYDTSGVGPGDHSSFYHKDIPVLTFFTGRHSDVLASTSTDDPDKINYSGELEVVKYVYGVVENANIKGKLAFSKTKESQMGKTATVN